MKLRKMMLNINGVDRMFMCDPENDKLSDVLRRIGLTGVFPEQPFRPAGTRQAGLCGDPARHHAPGQRRDQRPHTGACHCRRPAAGQSRRHGRHAGRRAASPRKASTSRRWPATEPTSTGAPTHTARDATEPALRTTISRNGAFTRSRRTATTTISRPTASETGSPHTRAAETETAAARRSAPA